MDRYSKTPLFFSNNKIIALDPIHECLGPPTIAAAEHVTKSS